MEAPVGAASLSVLNLPQNKVKGVEPPSVTATSSVDNVHREQPAATDAECELNDKEEKSDVQRPHSVANLSPSDLQLQNNKDEGVEPPSVTATSSVDNVDREQPAATDAECELNDKEENSDVQRPHSVANLSPSDLQLQNNKDEGVEQRSVTAKSSVDNVDREQPAATDAECELNDKEENSDVQRPRSVANVSPSDLQLQNNKVEGDEAPSVTGKSSVVNPSVCQVKDDVEPEQPTATDIDCELKYKEENPDVQRPHSVTGASSVVNPLVCEVKMKDVEPAPQSVTNADCQLKDKKQIIVKELKIVIEDVYSSESDSQWKPSRVSSNDGQPLVTTGQSTLNEKKKRRRPVGRYGKNATSLPRYTCLPNMRAKFSPQQILKNKKLAQRNKELLQSLRNKKRGKDNDKKIEKEAPKQSMESQMIENIVKSRDDVTQNQIELEALYAMNKDSRSNLQTLADLAIEGEEKRMQVPLFSLPLLTDEQYLSYVCVCLKCL